MRESNLYLKALHPIMHNGKRDYIMITEEVEEDFKEVEEIVVDEDKL